MGGGATHNFIAEELVNELKLTIYQPKGMELCPLEGLSEHREFAKMCFCLFQISL